MKLTHLSFPKTLPQLKLKHDNLWSLRNEKKRKTKTHETVIP